MAVALAASWFAQKEPTAAANPTAAPGGKPAEATDKTATADEPKNWKDQVAALARRVDELQGKLDADKPAPAGDLKPLKAKVDALATVPELVKPLPKKLDDLDGRIAAMGADLVALKAEVAALKKGSGAGPGTAAAPRPEVKDVDVANQAMSDAVALFKAAKYKEASAAFAKIAQVDGNDARVWYYAALANALANKNWKGEPETLAKKGVDREKARSPESARIDEIFTDLTAATGKDWLAYFRKSARP